MDLKKVIFKVNKRENHQKVLEQIFKNQEINNIILGSEGQIPKNNKINNNLNLSSNIIKSQYHPKNNNLYNNKQKMNKSQYSAKENEIFISNKDYISYLMSNQKEYITPKGFNEYISLFPEWENYELILILVIGEMNNHFENFKHYINLYLCEGMKKILESKFINDLLSSNGIKYDDNNIQNECIKFYKYKKEQFKKNFNFDLNISECYNYLIASSLIYQKLKFIEELDLTQYNLKGDIIQPILSAIKFNEHIQKLILTDNIIGEDGCYWLGTMLRNNKQLSELDLSHCKITNRCIMTMIKGLKFKDNDSYNLKKINLTENEIISEKGGEELGNFLEKFNMLNWLNVCKNKLKNDGLKNLLLKYQKLINNENGKKTKLETLILFGNDIKSLDSLSLLGKVLKNNNCTLKCLVLSDNEINSLNNENFKSFCKDLAYNNSLTELLLLDCKIRNEDVEFLCEMLEKNKKLEKLCLYNNSITSPEKFLKILSVFKGQNGNKTLKELDLSKNNCKIPINEEFLDDIKNIQLESLDISQNFELTNSEDLEKFKNATTEVQDKIKIIY